jgi:hypothetical protein
LDDQGDPGGPFAFMNELACGFKVFHLTAAPLWAHLGSLGQDFSPEPLLRYSFIEIERPN